MYRIWYVCFVFFWWFSISTWLEGGSTDVWCNPPWTFSGTTTLQWQLASCTGWTVEDTMEAASWLKRGGKITPAAVKTATWAAGLKHIGTQLDLFQYVVRFRWDMYIYIYIYVHRHTCTPHVWLLLNQAKHLQLPYDQYGWNSFTSVFGQLDYLWHVVLVW